MPGADALTDEAGLEPLVARSDAADRLVSADPPLAAMQIGCGGEIPGLIAAPGLLELVRKARGFGMRLGRPLSMRHDGGRLDGWAEVEPDDDGCSIRLSDWQEVPIEPEAARGEETRLAVENLLAEGVVWLDEGQRVVALESQAADLEGLVARARGARGKHWTHLFDLSGTGSGEPGAVPPIWRVRAGMDVQVEGSARDWHLLLAPAAGGYQLLLRPLGEGDGAEADDLLPPNLLGDELAPALHDPVRRIIRQAEAIRDRLAGPLPEEYRGYASDIVNAGKHLRELADELGDAEAIEHGTIEIDVAPVALEQVAREACRLLQVKADERNVTLAVSGLDVTALADRRRLMQILLNIVGNAIAYGPEGGRVEIAVDADGALATLTIADEGEGLSPEDRIRMFEKFERLGRSDSGGSGLGLYIALMLARAMGGDIEAEAGARGGTAFRITLPRA